MTIDERFLGAGERFLGTDERFSAHPAPTLLGLTTLEPTPTLPPIRIEHANVESPWLLASMRFATAQNLWWQRHQHSEHELLWSAAGTITLEAAGARWTIPPSHAVWIPAGLPHRVRAERNAVTYATYVSPGAVAQLDDAPALPNELTGIAMTAVIAELLHSNRNDAMPDAVRLRMQRLALDLIQPVKTAALGFRLPTSPRLHALGCDVVGNPADPRTTHALAARLGVSQKTLTRAWVRECGMTFTQWRILVRVRAGLAEIAAGRIVARAASSVGYASVGTFSEAVREVTGRSPATFAPTSGTVQKAGEPVQISATARRIAR